MSLVLNTNLNSLNAQNNLSTSGMKLSTALAQLSSGLRINTAADDAAGYAIVQGMTSQINGLNQAARNAADGVSLSQTASGSLSEIISDLQTMRDLAVQSLNATNSSQDRINLDQQFQQLKADINNVAQTASFNGVNLLDGSFQGATFQIGANAGNTITVGSVADTRATNLGGLFTDVAGTLGTESPAATGAIVAGAAAAAATAATAAGTALTAAAAALTAAAADASITAGGATAATAAATAATTAAAASTATTLAAASTALATAATALTAAAADASITAGGATAATAGATAATAGATAATTAATAYAAAPAATALVAGDTYTFSYTDANGKVYNSSQITITGDSATDLKTIAAAINQLSQSDGGLVATVTATGIQMSSTTSQTPAGAFSLTAGSTHVGTATLITDFGLSAASPAVTAAGNYLDSSSVVSVDSSNLALSQIDAALQTVVASGAQLGAYQTRFQAAISGINTTATNLSAARSQIQDTDYAQATSNLSKAQILQQASTAMVAQANMVPQNVLTLLQKLP